MNIIAAINDPRVIGDSLSPAQACFIKAAYRVLLEEAKRAAIAKRDAVAL